MLLPTPENPSIGYTDSTAITFEPFSLSDFELILEVFYNP
jgi:hypothetical protein